MAHAGLQEQRYRLLRSGKVRRGPVVYWMSRDQRIDDNWALLHAVDEAHVRKEPLVIVFCLVDEFLGAAPIHIHFLIAGLRDVEDRASRLGISFVLLKGHPGLVIPSFLEEIGASLLIADFDPLRLKRAWKRDVCDSITIPCHEVDAHNVVPCWIASPKQEYAARTFRARMSKLVHIYVSDFPTIEPMAQTLDFPDNTWPALPVLTTRNEMRQAGMWVAGGKPALERMHYFIDNGLQHYPEQRNDPTTDGQSGLSPWLHFGHISAQRIAWEAIHHGGPRADVFLEELIIRRELTDNFCFYNEHYDSFEGLPSWAKRTLDDHREDPRDYLYTPEQFERAETHDPLWNAAQREMARNGKMHGYLRMYWAKKILEWSPTPEEAIDTAIWLNNSGECDGRDPNGYVGILWSIGGLHDRPWFERPVYGKIRYMNDNGARRKFDVAAYIEQQQE